jgi:putative ABC transport system permease protein
MDISTITVPRLALAFIPVAVVVVLMWRWGQGYHRSLQAIARMLLQLTLIGYVLVYIFQTHSGLVISGVLGVMLLAASWIALNTVNLPKTPLFSASLVSVFLGGGSTLALISQGVLRLEPWFHPSYMVPLAGMIFAASMTNISLALERLHAELENGATFDKARDTAFRASMIPVINSFLAVGLISLPGMMTGQILSGVSPLIAVRYQIMVMCMIFGAAGLSTVCFLTMVRKTRHFREIH